MTKDFHNLLQRNESYESIDVSLNENADCIVNFVYDFGVLSAQSGDGNTHNYLLDDLGTPIRILGGGMDELHHYDEFGVPIVLGNRKIRGELDKVSLKQPFGFTGYRVDDVGITGSYFAQAREYKPEVGRFTAQDIHWNPENMIYGDVDAYEDYEKVIGPNASAIRQSKNLYEYTLNDPLNSVDLNGECKFILDGGRRIVQRVANTPVVRRAASRVANTPVVRRAVGWVSSTPLVREARNAYHSVAAWATNNPRQATAVGSGGVNATMNFVGQVADDGLSNVDGWEVLVSFGEGYLNGMFSTLFPKRNPNPWADNRRHNAGRVILPFLNFCTYLTGHLLVGGSDEDDAFDFWLGALFALVPGWRSGGMGPRSFGRMPIGDVIEVIRGSAGVSAFEELIGRGIDWLESIFGDDYNYEY